MPNVNLLNRTLTHIRQHPDSWDQGRWVNDCGTAFCFAGHAVNLSGLPINAEKEGVAVDAMPRGMAEHFSYRCGGYAEIRDVASYLLGIEDDTVRDLDWLEEDDDDPSRVEAAVALFYAGNSLEDLEFYVNELCDQAAAEVAS